jgi:hypothetical protein
VYLGPSTPFSTLGFNFIIANLLFGGVFKKLNFLNDTGLLYILTRQTVHVICNIEVRSRNHSCSGKTMIVTCYGFVSVALVMEHAQSTCGLSGCAFFLYYLTKGAIFGKTLLSIKRVLILSIKLV